MIVHFWEAFWGYLRLSQEVMAKLDQMSGLGFKQNQNTQVNQIAIMFYNSDKKFRKINKNMRSELLDVSHAEAVRYDLSRLYTRLLNPNNQTVLFYTLCEFLYLFSPEKLGLPGHLHPSHKMTEMDQPVSRFRVVLSFGLAQLERVNIQYFEIPIPDGAVGIYAVSQVPICCNLDDQDIIIAALGWNQSRDCVSCGRRQNAASVSYRL